jgi:hypothetical protein
MDDVEALLGIRPVLGGRHPAFGTHNALLSLGTATYLEIIAPDPDLPRPDAGRPFFLDDLEESKLASWALQTDSIEQAAASARAVAVELGEIQSGRREKTDGTVLSWRLTDPTALPLQGCVPFLIYWGQTPHPAASAPPAGELVELRVEHPEVSKLREAFHALEIEMLVSPAATARLSATIRTARGEVILG